MPKNKNYYFFIHNIENGSLPLVKSRHIHKQSFVIRPTLLSQHQLVKKLPTINPRTSKSLMCSVIGHYNSLVVLHKKLAIICFHVDHHLISLVVEVFFNCPSEKKHLCNLQVALEHTFIGIIHTKHIIQFVNFLLFCVYNDGLVKFSIQIFHILTHVNIN
jgi:hypothetical protein